MGREQWRDQFSESTHGTAGDLASRPAICLTCYVTFSKSPALSDLFLPFQKKAVNKNPVRLLLVGF